MEKIYNILILNLYNRLVFHFNYDYFRKTGFSYSGFENGISVYWVSGIVGFGNWVSLKRLIPYN